MVTINLSGRIDANNAGILEEEISSQLAKFLADVEKLCEPGNLENVIDIIGGVNHVKFSAGHFAEFEKDSESRA